MINLDHDPSGSAPVRRRPTILLVDDSSLQRRVLTAALRDTPFSLLEAASGEDALSLCRDTPPDIVVSDWMMPGMDGLVPDLAGQVERLQAAGANQYRFFRFEENGAIKAAFVFLRMDDSLRDMSAQVLALSQAVQVILLWSEDAFAEQSPLALADEALVLRPEVADVIRAAYDPVMPPAANDASHALRLAARVQVSA